MKLVAKFNYYVMMILFAFSYLYHIIWIGLHIFETYESAKSDAPVLRPDRGWFIEHCFYSESAAAFLLLLLPLLFLIGIVAVIFYRKILSIGVRGLLFGSSFVLYGALMLIESSVPPSVIFYMIPFAVCIIYASLTIYYMIQDINEFET